MDSEGSLAAFTLLPHAFHTSSITGTIPTAIPHATADPATISPSPTGRINDDTDTVGTLSGIIVCSDGGSISVYTDVRTKGTPRVAGLGKEIVYQSSNRSVNVHE
jgi:hypothetical protein